MTHKRRLPVRSTPALAARSAAGGRLGALLRSLVLMAGLVLACGAVHAQAVGAVRGVVFDVDFDVPLAGVRVTLVEALATVLTTADGNFLFERVPPGRYTLTFAVDGFERRVQSDVVAGAGRLTDLGRIDLSAEVYELAEMVVTGADLLADSEMGLIEIRAEALTMQDSISAELIGKAGASDVAGAIKLVTGVSVVEGKYATVRGLSDRYTGTTLNGVRVPSADPRRRAVQVDLFPTGTIESVTVTKTFTPDLQGDFTGGGIDIQTRSVPEGPTFAFSVSTENDSLATHNGSFLTYDGGGVRNVASDPRRGLPEIAREPLPLALNSIRFRTNPTPGDVAAAEAYDRLTRAFAPSMGVTRSSPGRNTGLSAVAGTRFDLGSKGVLGVLGALTWTHKYHLYENGINNTGAKTDRDQPIFLRRERSDSQGTDEILLGGLVNLAWQIKPEQELAFKLIANRSAEDTARFQVEDQGYPNAEQNQTLQYTERNVLSAQFHGGHVLTRSADPGRSGIKIDWLAALNQTRQDEPDVRFFRNVVDLEVGSSRVPPNSTDALNTRRIFRDIQETNLQGAFDVTLPFVQWSDSQGEVKSGLFVERSDRDYFQRSFTYVFPTQAGGTLGTICNLSKGEFSPSDPGELWSTRFTDADRIGLAPRQVYCDWFDLYGIDEPQPTPAANQLLWVLDPLPDDVDYTGEQSIDALYAMAELPLSPKFKLIGGARVERTELDIVPMTPRGVVEVVVLLESGDRAVELVPQEEAAASIEQTSWLPALSVVWEPLDRMNVRASWSRTLARPTFRELAPVATEEFIFGDEFLGNPEIQLSRIANYDLRWEWFRRPGELLSISGFYKELTNPIELISFTVFGSRTIVQPLNFETGQVEGAEIEARTSLDVLSPRLAGLSVGANYAVIDSEVEVPLAEQDSLALFGLEQAERRLQGQPDTLLNYNVTYDNDKLGSSAGLFYNRVGETLLTGAARGEDGTPNVFEKSFTSLDFTFRQRLREIRGGEIALALQAKNLLQSEKLTVYRAPDGDEAPKSQRDTGTRVSLSASVKW